MNTIEKVLFKGIKDVVSVTLESGKTLKLTPDHEVKTEKGWIAIEKLKNSDISKITVSNSIFSDISDKIEVIDLEIL